jgi:pimeloyl-ACP methyl ester carboxylesterase
MLRVFKVVWCFACFACFASGVTSFFIYPHVTHTKHCKRTSVCDLPKYYNISYDPVTDITFSKYVGNNPKKYNQDVVLCVPGLEFSALSLSQFTYQLEDSYDVVFVSSGNDVTPDIGQVINTIEDYIEKTSPNKRFILVGESSGSIITLLLGASNSQKIKNKITAICTLNSATAYSASYMQSVIEKGKHHSNLQYFISVILFLLTQQISVDFTNSKQFQLLAMMLVNFFHFPKEVLLARVAQWVVEGGDRLSEKYANITVPVATVGALKDNMFDSRSEAARLKRVLVNSLKVQVVHVPQCGHLIDETQFSLRKVIDLICCKT